MLSFDRKGRFHWGCVAVHEWRSEVPIEGTCFPVKAGDSKKMPPMTLQSFVFHCLAFSHRLHRLCQFCYDEGCCDEGWCFDGIMILFGIEGLTKRATLPHTPSVLQSWTGWILTWTGSLWTSRNWTIVSGPRWTRKVSTQCSPPL